MTFSIKSVVREATSLPKNPVRIPAKVEIGKIIHHNVIPKPMNWSSIKGTNPEGLTLFSIKVSSHFFKSSICWFFNFYEGIMEEVDSKFTRRGS